jgi:hypothetical protein
MRDRLIRLAPAPPDRAPGFADGVRWGRGAPPAVRAWTAPGQPRRPVAPAVAEPAPTGPACYGPLVRRWAAGGDPTAALGPRWVEGRPLGGVTPRSLAGGRARPAAAGEPAPPLVRDNAAWHVRRAVRRWIAAHTAAVKTGEAAVRLVPRPRPPKSPWPNPIAPTWAHGKTRGGRAGPAADARRTGGPGLRRPRRRPDRPPRDGQPCCLIRH